MRRMRSLNIAKITEPIIDKLITIALARTNGNKRRAAQLLGLSESSLWRKIRERLLRNE